MRELTATSWPCWQPDRPSGISSETSGPAAMASATLTGTRMATVQVSRAELIWLTSRAAAGSEPERAAGPASTGTMMAVSAPPRTMS